MRSQWTNIIIIIILYIQLTETTRLKKKDASTHHSKGILENNNKKKPFCRLIQHRALSGENGGYGGQADSRTKDEEKKGEHEAVIWRNKYKFTCHQQWGSTTVPAASSNPNSSMSCWKNCLYRTWDCIVNDCQSWVHTNCYPVLQKSGQPLTENSALIPTEIHLRKHTVNFWPKFAITGPLH